MKDYNTYIKENKNYNQCSFYKEKELRKTFNGLLFHSVYIKNDINYTYIGFFTYEEFYVDNDLYYGDNSSRYEISNDSVVELSVIEKYKVIRKLINGEDINGKSYIDVVTNRCKCSIDYSDIKHLLAANDHGLF